VVYLSEKRLIEFLESGGDWERMKTTIPGVFVLKLPSYKSSPARLVVELNPVDERGKPKKRRGLILRSTRELEEFKEMFRYEKLLKLLKMLDSINSKVEAKAGEKEDIIEI